MKKLKVTTDLSISIYTLVHKKSGNKVDVLIQLMEDRLISVFNASTRYTDPTYYHVYDTIEDFCNDWEVRQGDLLKIQKAIKSFEPVRKFRKMRKPAEIIDARPKKIKQLS